MAENRSGLSESDSAVCSTGRPSHCPLLVHLRAILPSLNPTERQIGEYILEDPERVLSSSISDMHRGSGASAGSIVGFCKTLGLKGFPSFKISLARELAQGGFSAGLNAIEGQPTRSLYGSVFQFHAQCLRETLQLNTEATFEEVSRTIELARRLEFFSIGMSYPPRLFLGNDSTMVTRSLRLSFRTLEIVVRVLQLTENPRLTNIQMNI